MTRRGKKNPNKIKINRDAPINSTRHGTFLSDTVNPLLLSMWPKPCDEIPPLFLHKPDEFEDHVITLIDLNVHLYKSYEGKRDTKIKVNCYCDYKAIAKYFDKYNLPYHTYGLPGTRKMKVVIKGLPHEVDVGSLKMELRNVSIPVIRVHKMHTKKDKERPALYLAVVPQDADGQRILQIEKIFGIEVTLEPPRERPEQCHRCQQWGHAQRYCHGEIKCVKCAGNHFSKKCPLPKTVPPTCANCGGEHTANFKHCASCPSSKAYKKSGKLEQNITNYEDIIIFRNGYYEYGVGDNRFSTIENIYKH